MKQVNVNLPLLRVDETLGILIDPTGKTTLSDIGAIRHELLQLLTPWQFAR